MNYYLEMYKSIISSINKIWNYMVSVEMNATFRIMIWVLVCVSLISLIQIVMMSNDKHDPRFGTVWFWVAISICTFGIGAIVIKCADSIMKSPRVFKRPAAHWAHLFLPTMLSVLSYFVFQTEIFHFLNGTIILPELIGLAMFVYLILENLLTTSNKSINFELPDNPNVDPLLKIIAGSLTERELALSKSTIIYKFRGDRIPVKRISPKELTRYLLLKEEEADCIYKEYLRYDGSTFRVAELENLYIPKLYDCLAGLLIWLMITTPYFSTVLTRVCNTL